MADYLSEEQFSLLTADEQEEYLALLYAEEAAWTLTGRQLAADRLADQVDELLYGGAAGGGKALAVWTPIPTPEGWTFMGLLEPGDVVLGADGFPTKVEWVSSMRVDRPCYRVVFDDGESIIADECHQWVTWDYKERARLNRRGKGAGQVRTTKQIAESVLHRGRTNHSIRVAAPLHLPEVDLPLSPYVLGAWLGDGSSAHGGFTTADQEILDEIHSEGFTTTKWGAQYAYGIDGLKPFLRKVGVLGNKHIPAAYLRAHKEDRLALLQGLMDTDGCVTASGGVEFTTTSKALADGTLELILSLGHKATLSEGRATLYGKDCGPKYRIKWSPHEIVFRLPRKADAQNTDQRGTQQWRYIVSVEPVESQIPVKCIGVGNDDHLFLAGRHMVPTHNSEWILHRAWKKSREIPNHRTLVLRTSFPELRRSIIQRSIVLYGQHTPPAERPSYRVSDKEWHFPNGSVIEFGYCASLEDAGQFLSAEYDLLCFDELTQFSEEQYDLIRSRARTTTTKAKLGARPHVIGATNPGQRGHGWVKSTFVDTTERGDLSPIHIRRDGEDNWIRVEEDSGVDLDECRHIAFVPSTVLDNPHIDPNYIKHLKTLSEKNRRRYLEGDWDQLEGAYFDEFRRSITSKDGREIPYHVIPSFPIPQSWPKIRGIDWGFAAPYACVWIAFDEEGTAHVYRERYAKRLTPAEQAKDVLSATPQGEKVDRTFADPACWHQRDNLTIAQQWAAHGLRAVKGNNDRLAGWQRLRDYMKPDEDGNPGIRIHESCPNLIRTIPFMIHDEHKQEDLDTTLEDHLLDALRYALMSRPRKIIPDRIELVGMAKRMANSFKRKSKNRHEILGKQV